MTMTQAATSGGREADRPRDGRWFLDTWMKVLADGAATDGGMAVIEWRGGAGFSPPLHLHHREDTAMLVLDGMLTVRVGDREQPCGPGQVAWLPREVPHTFRVETDTAHYLEMITPAGFENFHIEASRTVTGDSFLPAPTPIDVPGLVAHAARFDCDIIGPPMDGVRSGG